MTLSVGPRGRSSRRPSHSLPSSSTAPRLRLLSVTGLLTLALVATPYAAVAAEPVAPPGSGTTSEPAAEPTGEASTDPSAAPPTDTSAPSEPTDETSAEPTTGAPTEPTEATTAPTTEATTEPTTEATTEPTPAPTTTGPAAQAAAVTHVEIEVTGQTAAGAWVPKHEVRDGSQVRVYFAVKDERGGPRPGVVDVQYGQGGVWRTVARVQIKANGGGMVTHIPVVGTRYRIAYPAQSGLPAGMSRGWDVVVVPFVTPVALPSGAPRPSQAAPTPMRAPNLASDGAWPQVLPIGNAQWEHMNGISWRSGCPVGRSQLRIVRVNYIGFDGYRYRGELVVHSSIATRAANAFATLYDRRIPIRSMQRVDYFGYSSGLRGGDDYKSMAADNTSGFNCRGVVGRPSTRSPHAYGRSIDINPWENPYHSATGVVPNTWWVSRSHPQVAWRSRSHQVIQIMAHYGFRWTYGTSDAHHFDG